MSQEQRAGLAHMVFFTLKNRDLAAHQMLVAACRKYLTDHPGTVHFSVGPRATQYDRPVNDTEHDVALILIFASVADHDRYQKSDRHQQFIAEQSEHWSQVRVFDALV